MYNNNSCCANCNDDVILLFWERGVEEVRVLLVTIFVTQEYLAVTKKVTTRSVVGIGVLLRAIKGSALQFRYSGTDEVVMLMRARYC